MLTRADIERRVPHAGAMCLLDAVTSWDATHIHCTAAAPTLNHPLARAQGVPAVAAVEYAAQAAAVHGALLSNSCTPRAGVLAKLVDVELIAGFFDERCGALNVHAELIGLVDAACSYRFSVTDVQHLCHARGRLLVAFQS